MKLLLLLSIFSLSLKAQENINQESTELDDINVETEAFENDEADDVITNRRFRAQTGSLSKWSLATSWNYDAGSLEAPFDVERPNLNAAGDINAIQGINGTMNVSYRLTDKDRINLGVGLQMLAPFHSADENVSSADVANELRANQGELDFNNPSLTYSRIFKAYGIQNVVSFAFTSYTAGVQVDNGFDYDADIVWNTMIDIGTSGLSVGAYFLYTRFFNQSQGAPIDMQYAILPQMEYVINDTFNLRTIARDWWYQRDTTTREFEQLEFTQSVGLGISVTRDVFLYPNIQFLPEDLDSAKTNIGLNANINLF